MNYAKLIDEDTFIGQYMLANYNIETSQQYDFWGALWVLGSCLDQTVYVPRPMAPVFMNWYVILLADSGVTRKSTAIRFARTVAGLVKSKDAIITGKTSPEYLLEHMSRVPNTSIAASELSAFLGRESYTADFPSLLTDLYDCPDNFVHGTISRGAKDINEPYLTFLSASTPSWLRTSVNPTVVEGGFTSRAMFIHDEKPKRRVAWPEEPNNAIENLLDPLREAILEARLAQKISIYPAARTRFENWYKARDISSVEPYLASFLAREDSHVLRVAACLAINDGVYAIQKGHIDAAIKVVARVKASGMEIFANDGHIIKAAAGIDTIVHEIVQAGTMGIRNTMLYKRVRHKMEREDFDIIMHTMHEMGMVKKMQHKESKTGPMPIRYARTENLTHAGMLEELVRRFTV